MKSSEIRYELKREKERISIMADWMRDERTWFWASQCTWEAPGGELGDFHTIINIFDDQREHRNRIISELIRFQTITCGDTRKEKDLIEEEHV